MILPRALRTARLTVGLLAFLVGCEGDEGPSGPAGPPTHELSLWVRIPTVPTAIPADGASTYEVEVEVTSNGAMVGNQPVRFEVDQGAGEVSVVDTVTDLDGRAATTYRAGAIPGEVVVMASAPAGRTVAAAVIQLLLDPVEVVPALVTPGEIEDVEMHWSPDATRASISSPAEPSLYIASFDGGERTYVGPYTHGIWNPDGSDRLLVLDADREVFVVSSAGEVLAGPSPFGTPTALCWSAEGDSVLMGRAATALFDADLTGHRTLDVPQVRHAVALPDGGFLVARTVEPGRLFRIRPGASTAETIVLDGGDAVEIVGLTVDPTGERVALIGIDVFHVDGRSIYLVNPDGSGLTRLLSPMFRTWGLRWSPSGDTLAFSSNRHVHQDGVYLWDLTGSHLIREGR